MGRDSNTMYHESHQRRSSIQYRCLQGEILLQVVLPMFYVVPDYSSLVSQSATYILSVRPDTDTISRLEGISGVVKPIRKIREFEKEEDHRRRRNLVSDFSQELFIGDDERELWCRVGDQGVHGMKYVLKLFMRQKDRGEIQVYMLCNVPQVNINLND